ncbi:IclR family transcriptional regulator [Psychromarinibacter sp. C21-152]|uniref:IclR family transcriptional regulator n=1 Tax=Psychromarinibacter sediminicola TaxID=3033385 RepID=A0AAE3T9X7_9RHOB|nr:IclR family transcriptional regulator [Psychromarinibacter sediminicola]MDF0602707.1 IclR family transcriptional regulator [Psychromarinibacter sediminicola]
MGTITKALEILGLFSRSRPAMGLGEVVKLTGRDKATVHRHLVELAQNGFLEQDRATRAYRLGPAILRLGGVREATYPLRSALRPVVKETAARVGELVHASVLQGDMLSPIVHADPLGHGTQVHFDEGEMLPLHATSSGLAVLAFSEPSFSDRVLSGDLERITAQTLTDPARLRALLEDVRRAGIAQMDRGFDDEVSSLGAPVFGAGGEVVGAVSVAVPTVRAAPGKLDAMRPALCAAVVQATRALGGQIPPEHSNKWAETPETAS